MNRNYSTELKIEIIWVQTPELYKHVFFTKMRAIAAYAEIDCGLNRLVFKEILEYMQMHSGVYSIPIASALEEDNLKRAQVENICCGILTKEDLERTTRYETLMAYLNSEQASTVIGDTLGLKVFVEARKYLYDAD